METLKTLKVRWMEMPIWARWGIVTVVVLVILVVL